MSCRLAPEACRLAWIDGAATLTIEASRTAMNWPMSTIARTSPGRTLARARGAWGDGFRPVAGGSWGVVPPGRYVVMSASLPRLLSRYQEPGYPSSDATRLTVRNWCIMGSVNDIRRTELAAFLRSRRERISPEDVGLAAGSRRRTSGLRREEVAQLAGVGVTWYTWLEQGRPIHASVQVLGAIANTLQLDEVERQHLFRLAEVTDVEGAESLCPQLPPEIQPVLDQLSPMPASVLSDRFDILAWNAAYDVLFTRTAGLPRSERN